MACQEADFLTLYMVDGYSLGISGLFHIDLAKKAEKLPQWPRKVQFWQLD